MRPVTRPLQLLALLSLFMAALAAGCAPARPHAPPPPGTADGSLPPIAPPPGMPAAAVPVPPPPSLGPPDQSERSELLRRVLELNAKGQPAVPEDYGNGPILDALPAAESPAGSALGALRTFFKETKTGTRSPRQAANNRFIEDFLARNQAALQAIQTVRVLAACRVEDGDAAFDLRLLGTNGTTSATIFLRSGADQASWEVYDLQGDLSHMTEPAGNQYTGYVPQDVERSLIREGNAKPWL